MSKRSGPLEGAREGDSGDAEVKAFGGLADPGESKGGLAVLASVQVPNFGVRIAESWVGGGTAVGCCAWMGVRPPESVLCGACLLESGDASGVRTKDSPQGWQKQIRNGTAYAKRPNNFRRRQKAKEHGDAGSESGSGYTSISRSWL